MAQNDYFVIVYQVLKYLYECLKRVKNQKRVTLQHRLIIFMRIIGSISF